MSDDSSDSLEFTPAAIANIYHDQKPNINGIIDDGQPRLEIVEQPQTRGFRFRYGCEGASHGGLQGANSPKRGSKTYPTVQIVNYRGPARITVSLVTDENPPKPHCHQLIGKNCQGGVCVVEIRESNDMKAVLSNLGVLHITRRKVQEELTNRVLEAVRLEKMVSQQLGDPAAVDLTEEEQKRAREEAEDQAKTMMLNVVRLSFQAFLMENGRFSRLLPPVYSNPIFDSKSPGAAALKICRMDKHAGRCTGDDEVFLLCDKVQKDDITVRFYEEDEDERVKWEDFANFGPADVHRQYAIVFKTPPYRNRNIDGPVQVKVQLQRMSDEQRSEPKPFTYYPQQIDEEDIRKKRKKPIFPQIGSGSFPSEGFFNTGSGRTNHGGQNNNSFGGNHAQKAEDGLYRPRQAMAPVSMPTIDYFSMQPINFPELPSVATMFPPEPRLPERGAASGPISPLARPADNMLDVEEDAAPDDRDRAVFLSKPQGPTKKAPIEIKAHINEAQGSWVDRLDKTETVDITLDSGCGLSTESVPETIVSDSVSLTAPTTTKPQPESIEVNISPPPPTENTEKAENIKVEQPAAGPTGEPCGTEEQSQIALTLSLSDVWRFAENAVRALQDYSKTGEMSYILVILRKLIQYQDENGDNVLHLAVIHKQPVVLQNLLRTVATLPESTAINQPNNRVQTPLHLAVITNQSQVAQLLLDHNCDPAKRDLKGNTPTHLAALYGHDLCLESMLPLNKHKTTSGVSTQIFPQLNMRNFDGFSALHLAARAGNLKCVKILAQAGVDVNLQDGKSGSTALHHAVEVQSLPIVGYLILEAGADINTPRYDGNTPLHLASAGDMLGVAALLVATGADVDAENADSAEQELEQDDERDQDTASEDVHVNGDTPYDVAVSDKMRRILEGEAYTSVSDQGLSDVTGNRGSGAYSMPPMTGKGDMDRVDAAVRSKLAKLLDPINYGSDWVQLAELLELGFLVNPLRGDDSPTKTLLLQHEANDGTILKLSQSLKQMERYDALLVLSDADLTAPETSRVSMSNQQFRDVIETGFQRLSIGTQ